MSMEESSNRAKPSQGISDFSDPVYKKLSRLNGEINKLTKDELKLKLKQLGLNTDGVKDILKKRLKNYYRRRKLVAARMQPPSGTKYDYLIVIDFEATCEECNDNYKHEIIEFPAILVDVQKQEVVDKFHSYCRPIINPRLSPFCIKLTGISQDQVNQAKEFPDVLRRFEEWMASHGLGVDHSYAIVTDGPWDMSRFLHIQCVHSKLAFPHWGRKWINIRKQYGKFYQCKHGKIAFMLENLGLTFVGHLHCGLDDSQNIARIVIRMLADGCAFHNNEFLILSQQEERTFVEVKPLNPNAEQNGENSDQEKRDSAVGDKHKTKMTGDTSCLGRSASESTRAKREVVPNQASSESSLPDLETPSEEDDISDLLEYLKLQKS